MESLGKDSDTLINDQYGRYILQLRHEVDQLYTIFNLGLITNTGFLAFYFGKDSKNISYVFCGLSLSLLWCFVYWKQKSWRNHWLSKIKYIEKELDIPLNIVMWDHNPELHGPMQFFGTSKTLGFIPIFFFITWFCFLIFL